MKFLYAALILIVLFYITKLILKHPTVKGALGELRIKIALRDQKYVINNLILADERGRTSQIDHVVINTNGLYVIETKNYSGKIYGKDNMLEWTQYLGRTKNKFYNPVKQNATHIFKIMEITGSEIPIFTLIVFVKGNIEHIQSEHVYDVAGMKDIIKKGADGYELHEEKVLSLYNDLLKYKENCTITTQEHIKNIEKMQNEIKEGVCPRCGAKLVERNSKRGLFLGCSNYPKCKFTKDVAKVNNNFITYQPSVSATIFQENVPNNEIEKQNC